MHDELRIEITDSSPSDIFQWDQLAKKNSNLFQGSFYDESQIFFNQKPVYFNCFINKELVGGTKLFLYESKKLPAPIRFISRRATQLSEVLFDEDCTYSFTIFFNKLKSTVFEWLRNQKVAQFYEYSFYGEPEKLIEVPFAKIIWESKIGIALIDLTKSEEHLLENINPKHRRPIIKAREANLQFFIAEDIDSFLEMINEDSVNKGGNKLNKKFLKNEYKILRKNNLAQIAFVKDENEIISAALIYMFGKKAYYAFGGNKKSSSGAGQFLHWEIMKSLKKNEFSFYSLGETALAKDDANEKFSTGITSFKLKFGANQLPTFHRGYALKPLSAGIWKLMQKIFIR